MDKLKRDKSILNGNHEIVSFDLDGVVVKYHFNNGYDVTVERIYNTRDGAITSVKVVDTELEHNESYTFDYYDYVNEEDYSFSPTNDVQKALKHIFKIDYGIHEMRDVECLLTFVKQLSKGTFKETIYRINTDFESRE